MYGRGVRGGGQLLIANPRTHRMCSRMSETLCLSHQYFPMTSGSCTCFKLGAAWQKNSVSARTKSPHELLSGCGGTAGLYETATSGSVKSGGGRPPFSSCHCLGLLLPPPSRSRRAHSCCR